MHSFFLRKQPQIKAATPGQAARPEEALSPLPWYTGMSKRQKEKSQQVHQERVERYHQIHALFAKQVDVANIARQVGLSRQGSIPICGCSRRPNGLGFDSAGRPSLDPYKPYLIQRWNEGCRSA